MSDILTAFREKYPDTADIPDNELMLAIHREHYPDVHLKDFMTEHDPSGIMQTTLPKGKALNYYVENVSKPRAGETEQETQQRLYGTGEERVAPKVNNALGLALNATQGATFNYGDEIFGGIGYLAGDGYENTKQAYNQALDSYSKENPVKSTIAGLGGSVLNAVATGGLGLAGALPKGAGFASKVGANLADDAIVGAVSASGDKRDLGYITDNALMATLFGVGTRGVLGGGANLVASGLDRIKSGKFFLNAKDKAGKKIKEAMDLEGKDYNDISQKLNELGESGIVADTLNSTGSGLLRRASNVNPQARNAIEDVIGTRQFGQNDRLLDDLYNAGENRQAINNLLNDVSNNKQLSAVELLKRKDHESLSPQYNEAYKKAQELSGQYLPKTPFEDILSTRLGSNAYNEALKLSKDNAVAFNSLDTDLSRYDLTKRLLDDNAKSNYSAGNTYKGSLNSNLSKKLKETIDSVLENPAYAEARTLRQKGFQRQEAYDIGEQLGKGSFDLLTPQRAVDLSKNLGDNTPIRDAYTVTKAQLLKKKSTPDILNQLSTTSSKNAQELALGDRAKLFQDAILREKQFSRTARDAMGNSTTARQLSEMNDGLDIPMSKSGLISKAMQYGLKKYDQATGFDKQAPYIAEYLTSKSLPEGGYSPIQNSAIGEAIRNAVINRKNQASRSIINYYSGE